VIALKRDIFAWKRIGQQALDYTAGIGTTINIVAERHREADATIFVSIAMDRIDQSIEEVQSAVNVADDVNSRILDGLLFASHIS